YSCSLSHIVNACGLGGILRLQRFAEEIRNRVRKFRKGDVFQRILDGVIDFLPITAHPTAGQDLAVAMAVFYAFREGDGAVDHAYDIRDGYVLRRTRERKAAIQPAM